jgi:transcriptional regulator with XRE-family HTH domain
MARGWMTRSYRMLDFDPEIDKFRTIFQKEHLKEKDLAVLAGLSGSTINNMFGGQTKRPQHATFAKMAHAMGYEYTLAREVEPNYGAELPRAQAEYKAHLAALKKKRERQTNGKGNKK